MRPRQHPMWAAVGVLLLAGVLPARAATFDIMPTMMLLTPSQATGVFAFANRGIKTSYHVRIFHWTQQGGNDALEPTQAVIASPAIFTAEADQTQVIRVHARNQAVQGEMTYRLVIQELPHTQSGKAVVNMVMRLSLPVFVRSEAAHLAPALAIRHVGDKLQVSNNGNMTAKLVKVGFTRDSANPLVNDMLRYVLPGSSVSIPVPRDLAKSRVGVDLYAEGSGKVHFDAVTMVASRSPE